MFETVGLAHCATRNVNHDVYVWNQTLTIAVAAMDTKVEGLKLTSFVFAGHLHQTTRSANVLEKACGLKPHLLSALPILRTAMHSMASSDTLVRGGVRGILV